MKRFAAPPTFLAGQLAAADQSCRTASHILSGMCEEPETSDFSRKFVETLSAQISRKSDFDTLFLEGGAIQMGVSSTMANQTLFHGRPVARWLWESHCREEWCGVYDIGVYCYAPLTNKPCLVLCKCEASILQRVRLKFYVVLMSYTSPYCSFRGYPIDSSHRHRRLQSVAWLSTHGDRYSFALSLLLSTKQRSERRVDAGS